MRAPALLLALLAPLAAAASEPAHVQVAPDPPQAGAPFEVSLHGVDDAWTSATLKVCRAERGVAVLCALPVAMRREAGAFVATADGEILAPGGEFGVNVTLHGADGARAHVPDGARDPNRAYVFFVAAEAREAPAPAPAAALAALALAVIACRRRS